MRLVSPDQVPEPEVRETFRHAAWRHLVLVSLAVVPLVIGTAAMWHGLTSWPLDVLVTAVPAGLIVAGVLVFATVSLLSALRAALLPSNWIMKVTPEGVWLQLRSYRNHHFGPGDATVLFVAFTEIAAARRIRVRFESRQGGELTSRWRTFLELEVPGLDGGRLRTLIARELARCGPERRLLGLAVRLRHGHVPVDVPGPGVVRVEWRGPAMLAAVSERLSGPRAGAPRERPAPVGQAA